MLAPELHAQVSGEFPRHDSHACANIGHRSPIVVHYHGSQFGIAVPVQAAIVDVRAADDGDRIVDDGQLAVYVDHLRNNTQTCRTVVPQIQHCQVLAPFVRHAPIGKRDSDVRVRLGWLSHLPGLAVLGVQCGVDSMHQAVARALDTL